MDRTLERIMTIVERMEQDLASLKEQITQLLNEQQSIPSQKQKVSKSVQTTQTLSEEEMRRFWEQLESEYIQRGHTAILEFIEKHTKPFLKAFIRANNLPVDLKRSKKEIAEQLVQLLAVNKAISRPAFTRPPKTKITEQFTPNQEAKESGKEVQT